MADKVYQWTDDPMKSGVSDCNPDVVNECLMHLKYENTSDAIQNMYMTGFVETQSRAYNQLYDMAHSTFDRSKFNIAGNPIITDDGIFTINNGGEHVSQNINKNVLNTIKINVKGTYTQNTNKQEILVFNISIGNKIHVIYNDIRINEGNLIFGLVDYNITDNIPVNSVIIPITTISDGANIYTEITYTSTTITSTLKINDTMDYTAIIPSSGVGELLSVKSSESLDKYWRGSLDLKYFSVNIDGLPIFSGNVTGLDRIDDIQIPYTLSKTGAKIVDTAYRDMVQCLYEQQGSAPYYTIDEKNQNFTLPMGEIYGMIENKPNTNLSNLSSAGETKLQDLRLPVYCVNSSSVDEDGNANMLSAAEYIQNVYATAGTYSLTLSAGQYEIEMYGAGGGYYHWAYSKASGNNWGGSGAGFKGVIEIPEGTYTVTVGAYNGNATNGGSTSFGSLITCGGGGYDTNGYGSHPKGWCVGYGDGGTLSVSEDVTIISSELQSNGNHGGCRASDGGANTNIGVDGSQSLYNNTLTGYGAGSSSSGVGYSGYFRIKSVGGNYTIISVADFTATNSKGKSFSVANVDTIDVSTFENGTYNIYCGEDGNFDIRNNNHYVQKTKPYTEGLSSGLTRTGNVISDWDGSKIFKMAVYKPFTLSNGINYELTYEYTTGDTTTNGEFFKPIVFSSVLNNIGSGYSLWICADPNTSGGRIYVEVYNKTSIFTIYNNSMLNPLQANTTYTFKLTQVANGALTFSYSTDGGTTFTTIGSSSTAYSFTVNAMDIMYLPSGSVDLGKIKITGDVSFTYERAKTDQYGTVWVDNSVLPISVQEYTSNGWVDFDKVLLGNFTLEDSVITSINTEPYNKIYLVPAYIIDTYINGTSGYRVWSDGYCEQWGRSSVSLTTDQTATIHFLVPYKDANVVVIANNYVDRLTGTNGCSMGVTYPTPTQFTYSCDSHTNNQIATAVVWKSMGLINI